MIGGADLSGPKVARDLPRTASYRYARSLAASIDRGFDAVSVACTPSEAVEHVGTVVADLDVPAVLSAQASVWRVCRTSGVDPDPGTSGHPFETPRGRRRNGDCGGPETTEGSFHRRAEGPSRIELEPPRANEGHPVGEAAGDGCSDRVSDATPDATVLERGVEISEVTETTTAMVEAVVTHPGAASATGGGGWPPSRIARGRWESRWCGRWRRTGVTTGDVLRATGVVARGERSVLAVQGGVTGGNGAFERTAVPSGERGRERRRDLVTAMAGVAVVRSRARRNSGVRTASGSRGETRRELSEAAYR